MRKRLLSATLSLCMLLFAGCVPASSTPPEQASAPPEAAQRESVQVLLGVTFQDDTARLAHLNELVSKAGYDLTFENYRFPGSYSDAAMDAYEDGLAEKLTSNNSVAIVTEGVRDDLRARNALGDIATATQLTTPAYWDRSLSLADGESDCLPASLATYAPSSRVGVLVPADIAERYGKAIRTATDYEEFLRWAKANVPNKTPGRIPTIEYLYVYNTLPILDLFLPEFGYLPVDSLFMGGCSLCVDLKDTSKLLQTEQLPIIDEVVTRTKKWSEDGLVDLTDEHSTNVDLSSYASLLVNTSDFTSTSLAESYPKRNDLHFDASGYVLNVLYPDLLPNRSQKGPTHYVVCGPSANPAEFLRFLGDMNDDQELYDTVRLGDKGEDYTVGSDGTIAPADSALGYMLWSMLQRLRNPEREANWTLAGRPGNWTEEMGNLREVEDPNLTHYLGLLDELARDNPTSYEAIVLSLQQRSQQFLVFLRSQSPDALTNWVSAQPLIDLAEQK